MPDPTMPSWTLRLPNWWKILSETSLPVHSGLAHDVGINQLQKQHRQTNFIIPSLRKLKRSQPHHAMAVICHAKILERSAGRHAVALAYPHTRERFVKNVLNRNVQRVKYKIQIPVAVCARLKSSARIMACSMTTLVVAHAQILGMVNNAKSVPQNRVMVMVWDNKQCACLCDAPG